MIFVVVLCSILLGGCLQQAQLIVPETLLQQLEGEWQEADKPGNQLTFYQDETVKVVLPLHKPPLKLLTHLEAVTDGVVLNFGDRWQRPANVRYDEDSDRLILGFYSEDGKTETNHIFIRQR